MLIYMSFLIPVLHYFSNTFLMYFAKVSNHNGLKKKNFFVGLFFPDTKKKCANTSCCCSVAQSCPTLCDSMDCSIHRLPCPSLSPGACSNPCPLGRWCHPTISSSVVPFSFCLQSFPASGSFPGSWLFASSGQSIGASASASVLPMSIEGWFPLWLTGVIALPSKEIKA